MFPEAWKTAVSLLILASCSSVAQAAFQDPLDVPAIRAVRAASSSMTAVAVAGASIVAVGRRGLILVSDGDQHWKQATVPVSLDLTAVHFSSPTHGWAVGHGGVLLESIDAGRTWTRRLDGRQVAVLIRDYYAQRAQAGDTDAARSLHNAAQLVDEGPIHPFLDVWFESEKIGYVIGAFNLILRTDDGGKTWEPWLGRTENPQAFHLYSVRGAGGEVFIVGEQGLVLRLDRTAQRFRAVPTPYRGSFFGVVVQPDNVLVYGLRGSVYRSEDAGKSWQKVVTTVQTAFTGAVALPDGRIVLASQGGQVLISANQGKSFAALPVAKPMAFAGIVSVGAGGVALAGSAGVAIEPLK